MAGNHQATGGGGGIVVAEPVHEVPQWLKNLPIAPEFHPTLAEFEDPISYILKIEKQASKYGICKIVPPVSLPSKKTTISNLNRSISSRNNNTSSFSNTSSCNPNFKSPSSSPSSPTFTTRYQQIGFDPRKGRPVLKPVWQSGEYYSLQQFEAKAKQFEKIHLKKCGKKVGYSALEIETLFWRASVDKPFTVEYANDMPGSAFGPVKLGKSLKETGEAMTVGDTAWNMRGVARSKGSLLRFMKEEIPGVTSPMVYIAMLLSWFAWHVEDHDLHSLNYMHMGASKTWYGVPKDAAFAFQEVVRVHGYGGDFNPLVTFATLGEKTTVMSPEVLIGSGIPCCRLVQNVGEFVVTFPGAYHSGFSHGFNCAEASNIATPEWLRYAKDAAIRRASVNCPPMVSHFQLLYALALTLCSRMPMTIGDEPRSSRLKDKKKGEGEAMVKEFFVQSVMQNNDLLHVLSSHGSSCVLMPRNSAEISIYLNRRIGIQKKVKRRMSLGLCSNSEASKAARVLPPEEDTLERKMRLNQLTAFNALNETSNSVFMEDRLSSLAVKHNLHGNVDLCNSVIVGTDMKNNCTSQDAVLLEQGRFPCVQCGILNYACVAVIEPREAAAQYLMSADCNFFNEWKPASGDLREESPAVIENENILEPNYTLGVIDNDYKDGLYDVPVQSSDYQVDMWDQRVDVASHAQKGISSLALLASAYGNSSDSDEEMVAPEMVVNDDDTGSHKLPGDTDIFSPNSDLCDYSTLHTVDPSQHDGASGSIPHSSSNQGCGNEVSHQISRCTSSSRRKRRWTSSEVKDRGELASDYPLESDVETLDPVNMKRLKDSYRDEEVVSGRIIPQFTEIHETDLYTNQVETDPADSIVPLSSFGAGSGFSQVPLGETTNISVQNTSLSLMQISREESSRKHIFCLEHAVEVEKQLRPIGGANILLICHPEYPRVEAEAKSLTQDLGIDHVWKDISYREATKEDQERIGLALDDEEADPSNGDWSVKLGINLYYSVHLSKSPLYTKQMPYNSIIYKAFGCSSMNNPMEVQISGKVPGRQKKMVVAGKWCGKVWMSNQVHPYLVHREMQEEDSMNLVRTTPTLKPRSKLDRKVEINQLLKEPVISGKRSAPEVNTTIARKLGQKKKRKFGKAATKKQKSAEFESPAQTEEESSESDSSEKKSSIRVVAATIARKLGQMKKRKFGKVAAKKQKSPELESPTQTAETAEESSESDSSEKKSSLRVPTTIARKLGQMKKRKVGKVAAKKQKSPELESTQTAEDSSESDSYPSSNGRLLSTWPTKHERPVVQQSIVKNIRQCDSNKKVEIKGEPIIANELGQKKRMLGKEAATKPKSPQFESPTQTEEDSSESDSSPLNNGKFLRTGRNKNERPLLQYSRQYDSKPKIEIEGGPSTRLRRRPSKLVEESKVKPVGRTQTMTKKGKKALPNSNDIKSEEADYQCDLDGCTMGFSSKQELMLHKKNICSVKGCGKKFFSHKYLVQHRRVHLDDRPLKCPWKGCKMTFKWAWARTEHIRVHTGDRPYVCREKGCGQTFRFVSDFSRHKRKTGHSVKGKG
ncbi:Lysine-specific demethylase ref6 [Thalictrum thalictroides]|uniref:Lysine-specific demethylase ref6 n=1 Tax=Thalictrum thalictroides TaxID=46969 RepID=A0A7J6X1Q7_THATH|nr:Lysine-specific demethylase ref6 [Thalictrum thalictroides]